MCTLYTTARFDRFAARLTVRRRCARRFIVFFLTPNTSCFHVYVLRTGRDAHAPHWWSAPETALQREKYGTLQFGVVQQV
jgi:hypothetical protein